MDVQGGHRHRVMGGILDAFECGSEGHKLMERKPNEEVISSGVNRLQDTTSQTADR